MLIARLVDHIWATRKTDDLVGYKFMLAQVIDGSPGEGRKIVVVDTISAGIGDRVLVSQGSSARKMLGDDSLPIDAVVVGIIDEDCDFEKSC